MYINKYDLHEVWNSDFRDEFFSFCICSKIETLGICHNICDLSLSFQQIVIAIIIALEYDKLRLCDRKYWKMAAENISTICTKSF